MIENQEHSSIEVGSTRSFGVVFSIVFALIGVYPLLGGNSVRIWSLAIAGAFLLIVLVAPNLLRPLNLLWFRFGLLLARVVNPLVMLIVYITTIVPIGLLLRAFGKDLLRKRLDPDAPSYWIERNPAGPEPESMKEQF